MADILDNTVTRGTGEFLSHKAGPLPVWGWLVIAGGTAYGVRRYMNRAQASQDAATALSDGSAAGDTTDPSSGTYVDPSGSQYTNPGYGAQPYPAQPDPGVDPLVAWQEKAVRAVVDKGIANAYTAAEAIRKYLSSIALSAQEQAIVSEAIAMVGTPPNGIPAPATPSQPTPPAPPKPPGLRSVDSEIVLTPRHIPHMRGDKIVYDVRWLEKGSRKGITGTLQVQWQTGTGPYLNTSGLRVVNGVLANVSQTVNVGGRRSVRLSTAAADTVHVTRISNALTFTLK